MQVEPRCYVQRTGWARLLHHCPTQGGTLGFHVETVSPKCEAGAALCKIASLRGQSHQAPLTNALTWLLWKSRFWRAPTSGTQFPLTRRRK
jgi:hypothetical protein